MARYDLNCAESTVKPQPTNQPTHFEAMLELSVQTRLFLAASADE